MAKMMSNATKVKMSNTIHNTLEWRNNEKAVDIEIDKFSPTKVKTKKFNYLVKRDYHSNCKKMQKELGRVLTKEEKRNAFLSAKNRLISVRRMLGDRRFF